MRRAVLVVIAVAALVGAVLFVRTTTMTVHTRMGADSRLSVRADARWRGNARSASRLAHALTLQCVAETNALADVLSFHWAAHGRFDFTVAPALDEPDRRQLRGCLSDLQMSALLVSVSEMTWSRHGAVR
jgi:hypothetical protein